MIHLLIAPDLSYEIVNAYNQDLLNCPEAFVGTLSQIQLATIRNRIIGAKTIKGKIKKIFGLYDHEA